MAIALDKVLRRTASGGSLVLVLALLLWLNDKSSAGLVLEIAIGLVLAGAVFELSRMGRVRELAAGWVLGLAAALSLLMCYAAREARLVEGLRESLPQALTATHTPQLWFEALCILLFAWALYALQVLLAPRTWLMLLAGAALLLWLAYEPLSIQERLRLLPWLCAGFVVLALPMLLRAGRLAQLGALGVLSLWLLPALPVLAAVYAAFGTSALVALLALSKIGDTAGYYGGITWGRRHPFPNISPGKTEWGCVASFVAATLLGGLLAYLQVLPELKWGWAGGLVIGASLNLAAQAGDLFESAIKRRAGVKDSSGVFGPSGGLLDQLDSLLFALPMAAATWPWLIR